MKNNNKQSFNPFRRQAAYPSNLFAKAKFASKLILVSIALSIITACPSNRSGGGTSTPAPTITVTAMPQSAVGSVLVTWTEPTDADFLGVTITYTVAGGMASTPVRVAKGTTTQTFTGLTGGAAYTFTVSAVNGSGTLAAGTVSTTTVATATATATPPLPTIASGISHSCAVDNGRAYCWGLQTNGRLGNGVTTAADISNPVAVLSGVQSAATNTFLTGVTAISTGQVHSCAIASGTVYCWGSGGNGRLGNGATGDQSSPVAVLSGAQSAGAGSLLTGVTAISTGDTHTCAIANRVAYCWGGGSNGQIGNGATTDATTPVAVLSGAQSAVDNTFLTGVTAISSGSLHSCAVANGTSYCWGLQVDGRLGNGVATNANISSPVAVLSGAQSADTGSLLTGVTAVSSDLSHVCAIANEQVYCWGRGGNGRLGNGAVSSQSSPVAVLSGVQSTVVDSLLTGITAITVGSEQSCAVNNGRAYCWGLQTDGRLGNGVATAAAISSPVAVLSGAQSAVDNTFLTGVTAISSGDTHNCAIANRVAYCWGNGGNGRLGNAATGNQSTPVAVGDFPR